jgi:hypothetical protein
MNYNKRPTRKGGMTTGLSSYGTTMGCAHCERRMNNLAGGFSKGYHNEPLCHPNVPNRPDCYKLVTLYKHPTPCDRTKCYEDHPNLLDYVDNNDAKVPF